MWVAVVSKRGSWVAEVPQEHRKAGEQGVAQLEGGQSTGVWGLRAGEEHRLGLFVWLGVFSGLEGNQEGYVKHTQLQGEGRPR